MASRHEAEFRVLGLIDRDGMLLLYYRRRDIFDVFMLRSSCNRYGYIELMATTESFSTCNASWTFACT